MAGQRVVFKYCLKPWRRWRPGRGFVWRIIEDFLAVSQVLGEFPVVIAEGAIHCAGDTLFDVQW